MCALVRDVTVPLRGFRFRFVLFTDSYSSGIIFNDSIVLILVVP